MDALHQPGPLSAQQWRSNSTASGHTSHNQPPLLLSCNALRNAVL
jgi:hypothetical protein